MSLADTLRAWGANPLVALAPLLFVMVMATIGTGMAALVAMLAHPARRGVLYGGAGLSLGALSTALLLRAIDVATPLLRGGPEGWVRSALGSPSGGWYPSDVLAFMLVLHGMLLPAWGLLAGVVSLKLTPRPLRLLGGGRLALALLAAAWVVMWVLLGPLSRQGASIVALDAAALGLVCMSTLALATLGADKPGTDATPARAGVQIAPTRQLRSPRDAWVEAGAVGPQDAPFLQLESISSPGGRAAAVEAWQRAGGHGAPPEALDALCEPCEPWSGVYLADLPSPTDDVFHAAALVLHARSLGRRVLVVQPKAPAARDRLLHALGSRGGWLPGPTPAGLAELRDALTQTSMPALAFLSPEDLATGALRLLGNSETGGPWLARVGLLALPGLDHGTPFELTNRFFLLRRLHLLLVRAGAAPSFLVTGAGGDRSVALARSAFPGLKLRPQPLGARGRAELSVWLASHRFRSASGASWAQAAAAPLIHDGRRVHVSDPTGAFSEDDLSAWSDKLSLTRHLGMPGAASVALLDEASLIAACRAAGNLVPTRGVKGERVTQHHTLWGLTDNPLTRFLVAHHASLTRRGRLIPPEPLIGHSNRALGRAHLHAATEDTAHALAMLRAVFGDSLCDELLDNVPTQGFLARRGPDGRLQRSPILDQSRTTDTSLGETVTDKPVAVVNSETGRTIFKVERLTAATRMYPRRVFSHLGRRFEVQMHGLDLDRGQLRVQPVRADQPLTAPILDATPRLRRVEEDPQRVHSGPHAFTLSTVRVQVHESVRGVVRGDADTLRFEHPVQARYITLARAVLFERAFPVSAGLHLAAAIQASLRAHLHAAEDDVAVVAVPAGFIPEQPAGVLIIDRHVMGMGVAEALHERVVRSVLDWTSAILQHCPCDRGCGRCTPSIVLQARVADKDAVLAVLNP